MQTIETHGNQPQFKLITNYEVYEHLAKAKAKREQQNQGKRQRKHQGKRVVTHTEFIEHITHFSLQKSAASEVDVAKIRKFLAGVGVYKLTKSEVLQIINLLPRTLVEIHLIIEECQERLTDEEVESLLQLIIEAFEIKLEPPVDPDEAQENPTDTIPNDSMDSVDPAFSHADAEDEEYADEMGEEVDGEGQEVEEEDEEEEEEDQFEFVTERGGGDDDDDDD